MSNSQRLFADAVNDTMEKLLKPLLEEERKNLMMEGVEPEEIERRLLDAKIDTQAKYLPVLEKMFKERLRQKSREDKNSNLNTTYESADAKAGKKFSK